MKTLYNVLKRVQKATAKQTFVLFAMFLTLSIAGIMGVTNVSATGKAAAAYCGDPSKNSIIPCGEPSRADFIKAVKASPQLQAVYKHFGLAPADYNRFINDAKQGTAYSYSNKYGNNVIVVDGQVVATGSSSIGNFKSYQGTDPQAFHISGKTYYGNLNTKAFASGTTAIPVDVLFNEQGAVQFVVMTGSCANPGFQTQVTPTYACTTLHENKVAGTDNTYKFSTDANAGKGAQITKLVYHFGDDNSTQTTSSPSDVVKHTFTKDATVTVTVYVSLPGGGSVKLQNADCSKQIKFTPPAAVVACTLLSLTQGKTDDKGNTSYTLNAKATAKHATIKSYTFRFGDGSAEQVVTTNNNSASTNAHSYAPGTYVARVLVTFVTDDGKTVTDGNTGDCAKTFTVKPMATSLACTNLALSKGIVDQTTGSTTYTLTAKATANNATITSYTFSYGDSTAAKTVKTAAGTTSVSHVYAPGTYIATVTVNGTDIYGNAVTSSTAACKQAVTIKPVGTALVCGNLTDTAATANATTGATPYTFTATSTSNNVTITGYTFNFGDNSAPKTVTTSAATASASHTYAVGKWTATVTVTGKDVYGKVITTTVSNNCSQTVTVAQPTCKPGVPVGSPKCSTLACTTMTVTPGNIDSTGNQTYTLNATATADNATITGYTFNFGDNTNATVASSSTTASTTHTYAAGNYVATVTVNGTDANGNAITATAPSCDQPISVNQPTSPNISLTKTVDGVKLEQVAVGQNFVYQLVIKNTGTQDLTNVAVTDPAPAGVTMISADLGTIATNNWTYTIPDLAIGQTVTVNITADVASYVAGNLVNTACVNAPQVNPTQPTQNDVCDTATVTVTPPATTPTPPAPTTLVNTGAGSVISIFAASAIVGTLGFRFFTARRLSREG